MATAIDTIFATIFLISFIGKIRNMKESTLMVQSYGVVPTNLLRASTIALVTIEFLLVILFVSGVLRWARDVMTILLMLFFILIILVKRRNQKDSKACSCIGDVEFINKYPITRNIIFIGILLTDIFVSSHHQPHEYSSWTVLMLSIIFTLLSEVLTRYKFVKGYKDHVVS